jgi:hypothetical protein
MREIQETNTCGRAEQLVGYLYGEATAGERADFEQHLPACAACRDELAAFGVVRTAVGEWRAELLRAAPALALSEVTGQAAQASAPAPPASRPAPAAPRPVAAVRSARAALREFFSLSPAWLRVSSAAAALLFCVLAAQAALNLRPSAVSAPPPAAADDRAALASRLDALTAERDAARRELEETRAQLDDSRALNIEDAVLDAVLQETAAEREPEAQDAARPRRNRTPARRGPAGQRGARRPRGDEDLPRLLDLLNDAN